MSSFAAVGKPGVMRAAAIGLTVALTFGYLLTEGVNGRGASGGAGFVLAVLLAVWGFEALSAFRNRSARSSDAVRKSGPKRDFDWGMHYFRGFAIVCIVLMHIQSKLGYTPITRAFFKASTVYFLFISGYLCQYLHSRHPSDPIVYYRKKLENVISPYVIWTFLTVGAIWLIGESRTGVIPMGDLNPRGIVSALLTGCAQRPYWYIPFVTFLFAVSPLILRLTDRRLVWLTFFSFVSVLILPYRGGFSFDLSTGAAYFKFSYFLSSYLIGFVYARKKDLLDRYLADYAIPATVFALLMGVLILNGGFFAKVRLPNDGLILFQKILFVIPVLVVAGWVRNRKIALLDMLAKYSFTLFFLHYFFIGDCQRIQTALHQQGWCRGDAPAIIADYGLIVLFFAFLLGLSVLLKTALGRNSRSFIGS